MRNAQTSAACRARLTTYLLALATLFITIAIIRYPKDTFDSAILGLNLWWNVVFPSLLPFFILSELLMGLGIVHALGVLLEPLMRPIFNVPGIGALERIPFGDAFLVIRRFSYAS